MGPAIAGVGVEKKIKTENQYYNQIKNQFIMKKFFIPLLTITAFALGACCGGEKSALIRTDIPAAEAGQEHMLAFAADPIPVVRVGFIGVGDRGINAVARYTHLEGVEIKALSDMEPYNIDRAQRILSSRGLPAAEGYVGDENTWKQLCERDDIDLVYICTDWKNHTPMAVYAMEQGKHVAIEVPAATTLEECWQLVNTSEKTRKHCMMLENCCYDFFEMATLNMAQQGVFGEVVHVEGAYIHDLRQYQFAGRLEEGAEYNPDDKEAPLPQLDGYYDWWRLKFNTAHSGNPYPTHGLGPVCQILNIHRGDKMDFLVSVSSGQFGLTQFAKENFGPDSPEAQQEYLLGDMNVALVRTSKGKTIMIQHDVTSPRPYSRLHVVSGTKGFAQKYPAKQIALDPHAHSAMSQAAMDSILAVYEHPITREIGDVARKVGGHGGMDFIMDYRLIYCLQNGLPLDQDVYDAAEWSSLVALTEISVMNGGAPVEVPDFTRGNWQLLDGLNLASSAK